jgi:glycine reductase
LKHEGTHLLRRKIVKLELHKIAIRRLRFDETTKIEGDTLYINKDELKALLLENDALASVEFELAHPGEKTRIMPVKDAIEPRCKLAGKGEVFPGFIGSVETVGDGRTLVLEGMAVLTTGRLVAPQEGIVDMSGPGAEYTHFSTTTNLVVVLTPRADITLHEAELCCRAIGVKTAHYLASKCKNAKVDKVESYDFPPLAEAMKAHPELPKVAYLYMLQSQGLLHDTWVYGVDAKKILPTFISPTEIMDGAIISGNCVSACDKNNTYVHQNNPVIKALFQHHGKELNFVGVVITNENVTLTDKLRSSSYAVNLLKMLGVQAAVITEEGFGNPDADLILNCTKAEKAGIKTVLITDEYAGTNGASQSLADSCHEGTAVVTGGNANATLILPPMDKIIGDIGQADVIAGGFFGSKRPDGSLEVEIQAVLGSTNELGFNKLGAYTI